MIYDTTLLSETLMMAKVLKRELMGGRQIRK